MKTITNEMQSVSNAVTKLPINQPVLRVGISFTHLWLLFARDLLSLAALEQLSLIFFSCHRKHIHAQGIPMEVTWADRSKPCRYRWQQRTPKGVKSELVKKWKAFKKAIQRMDAQHKVFYNCGSQVELAQWIVYNWPTAQILSDKHIYLSPEPGIKEITDSSNFEPATQMRKMVEYGELPSPARPLVLNRWERR